MFNRYSTLSQATSQLKKRGFSDSFTFEKGKMRNLSTGKKYGSGELLIVEFHRFEGMSNPSDMSVVYALETTDGRKGMIISAYGPYVDMKIIEFLDKIRIKDRDRALG